MSEADARPKAVSLFSGGGGLDLGLEEAGFSVVFATDWEPRACDTLTLNQQIGRGDDRWFEGFMRELTGQHSVRRWSGQQFDELRGRVLRGLGTHAYLDEAVIRRCDVRALPASDITEVCGVRRGDVEVVAGGPPCQSFSRSGQRGSVDDERGQLFMEFVRIVRDLRPRWFLFENVKGLILTKTNTWRMRCGDCGSVCYPPFDPDRAQPEHNAMAERCADCGSQRTRWQVSHRKAGGALDLIVAEFERIGYRCHVATLDAASFGAPQYRERLFIVGSRDGEAFAFPSPTHGGNAGATLPLFPELGVLSRAPTVWDTVFHDGRSPYHGDVDPSVAVLWLKNVVRPHDEPVTWTLMRPSPTIGAHQSAKLAVAPFGVPKEQLLRQQWHVLGRRQGDTPPVAVQHTYLSDEDLLRLQTFPAWWFVAGTRMERAFQIGNAVPPVLAKAIGNAILAAGRDVAIADGKSLRQAGHAVSQSQALVKV